MKRKNRTIIEQLPVTDYAAEGKSLARLNGKVVFIEGAVPGDIVDVLVSKSKKDWAEGRAINFHEYSTDRVQPFCKHFGLCGGCKWQMLPYEKQLIYKQREVEENLKRIGRVSLPAVQKIIGAEKDRFYRNKLEFTFSNKRYLSFEEMKQLDANAERIDEPALGFHVPRLFDKVIDIEECFLQDETSNLIRNTVREFALAKRYSFYDIRNHQGWLRTLIIRTATTGELMVNICFGYDDETERIALFDHLLKKVPSISTLLYTINPKFNDSLHDLDPQPYFGKGFITERLGDFVFKIGPKSFFQTNSNQAEKLYTVARDFAQLDGSQTVYDLYCGTGSIGIFVSRQAKRIIGVEAIDDAIENARENASINKVEHASFFTGDVTDVCTDDFFRLNGKPHVIITDPPRAGMHEKLVLKILETEAPVVVYVSCNPSTQARDLNRLDEKYSIECIQPVDMFPHTHHIENVVQLKLRNL